MCNDEFHLTSPREGLWSRPKGTEQIWRQCGWQEVGGGRWCDGALGCKMSRQTVWGQLHTETLQPLKSGSQKDLICKDSFLLGPGVACTGFLRESTSCT